MQIIEEQGERTGRGEGDEEVEHLLAEGGLARDCGDRAAPGEGFGESRAIVRLIMPEEFDPRPIGRRLGEVVAPTDEHLRSPLGCLTAQGLREHGLANPRLSADQYEATLPRERGIESLPQAGEFAVSSDKGWQLGHEHLSPDAADRRCDDYSRTV